MDRRPVATKKKRKTVGLKLLPSYVARKPNHKSSESFYTHADLQSLVEIVRPQAVVQDPHEA